jgi:hypothetical protein
VTERDQAGRGSSPAVSAQAGDGRPATALRGSRPAPVGTFRTVIGVGPGNRPAARLSPIASGPGRVAVPRSVPPQPPRPMHPPIARVGRPPGASPAALQASAVAARRGPGAAPTGSAGRVGFGMPSLRRNICPHFFMTGARGAMPIQAPHLLKALVRQEANVSRCQLRGGVHLEQGYVNDVCLSARFNQCVFYEDELTR